MIKTFLAKYKIKCGDGDTYKFLIQLGCLLTNLTECLCSGTKGGFMHLGNVINLNRIVR